jgi:uncharacterized membrane protein (DUF485 family)
MFTDREYQEIDKKNQRLTLKLAAIYILLICLFITLIVLL